MTVLEMPKKSKREILKELAAEINNHHSLFEESFRTSLEHGIEVGMLLIQAKNHAGHGNWTIWVNAFCPFKLRMAEYYMLVAKGWKELKTQSIADLTLTEVIKLLRQSNKINKNHNNKDTLPKDLQKELATLNKIFLEGTQSIKRIKEIERKKGKKVWARNGMALALVAKRAERMIEDWSEYFGKRN